MTRLAVAILVAALAVAVPAAGATKTQKRTLSADAGGALRFTKTTLRAHRGVVKIVMSNPRSSGLPHGIAIRGHGIDRVGSVVDPGGTARVKAKLKKGTYTFYCPFDGHAAAGMRGRLIVR
jgi:plastocyanin